MSKRYLKGEREYLEDVRAALRVASGGKDDLVPAPEGDRLLMPRDVEPYLGQTVERAQLERGDPKAPGVTIPKASELTTEQEPDAEAPEQPEPPQEPMRDFPAPEPEPEESERLVRASDLAELEGDDGDEEPPTVVPQ